MDGTEVIAPTDLVNGNYYVAANGRFKRVDYLMNASHDESMDSPALTPGRRYRI